MKLIPYGSRDPFRALTIFQEEMNKLFDTLFSKPFSWQKEILAPSVDVSEDEDNIYVEADIPGMEPKDIKVKMKGNSLVISAKKEATKEEKKKNYYHSERFQGSFYRELDLPSSVDASKIKATHKNGVLKVILPKKEEEKGKEIEVTVE